MENVIDLRGLAESELEVLMHEIGEPTFRGRQLFRWLQRQGVKEFSAMKNISAGTVAKLEKKAKIAVPKIITRQETARKDTVKMLLELSDGEKIETVLMLYKRGEARDRASVCVSTQSGCAMNCKFCATATVGPGRNLSVGEIVSQVLVMEEEAKAHGFEGVTNIVFMGMGEPTLNLENVHKSLQLFNAEDGLNIGMRRMTISTCGIVPAIYEMAQWGLQVGLAISLHAPTDALREQLMPIAQKYKLQELLKAVRNYRNITGQRIMIEYAMFRGVNDHPEHANALGKLLEKDDVILNLIPANVGGEAGYLPSTVEVIKEFNQIVSSYGIEISMREPRGVDIDAACGQLRRR